MTSSQRYCPVHSSKQHDIKSTLLSGTLKQAAWHQVNVTVRSSMTSSRRYCPVHSSKQHDIKSTLLSGPLNQHDIKSLDFEVISWTIRLQQTRDINVVNVCQDLLNVELRSVSLAWSTSKFLDKCIIHKNWWLSSYLGLGIYFCCSVLARFNKLHTNDFYTFHKLPAPQHDNDTMTCDKRLISSNKTSNTRSSSIIINTLLLQDSTQLGRLHCCQVTNKKWIKTCIKLHAIRSLKTYRTGNRQTATHCSLCFG